jgi:hypothetical protein
MANPNIASPTTVNQFMYSGLISTSTAENILSNAASSGILISGVKIWLHNTDGTNAVDVTLQMYDQDGVGMNTQAAAFAAAIGADTVAGSSLGGFTTINLPADASLVILDGGALLEDKSYVLTCSAANDVAVWMRWAALS